MSLLHLRRFHRWHALVMSVIVITSAGSGLIHTWMAHNQSPPPAARPGAAIDLAKAIIPPHDLTQRLPTDAGTVLSASLRPIGDDPWYQVITSGRKQPYYVHAGDGRLDDDADARYAAQIASSFLGGTTVTQTSYLTTYDDEYIAIFRILPVYRFAADDGKGTRVYVSTMTGSVTRHTDDGRQFEAGIFTNLHKWNFIRNRAVRDWALMITMGGLIVLAASGLVLFVMSSRRRS